MFLSFGDDEAFLGDQNGSSLTVFADVSESCWRVFGFPATTVS